MSAGAERPMTAPAEPTRWRRAMPWPSTSSRQCTRSSRRSSRPRACVTILVWSSSKRTLAFSSGWPKAAFESTKTVADNVQCCLATAKTGGRPMADTNNPTEPEAVPSEPEAPAAAAPAPAPPPQPARGGGGGVIVLILLLLVLLLGGGAAGAWFFWLPHHPMPALSTLKLPFLPHPTPAPGTSSTAPAPAPVVAQQPAPVASSAAAPSAAAPSGAAPRRRRSQPSQAPGGARAGRRRGPARRPAHAGLPRDTLATLAAENGKLVAATPDQTNALAMAMRGTRPPCSLAAPRPASTRSTTRWAHGAAEAARS